MLVWHVACTSAMWHASVAILAMHLQTAWLRSLPLYSQWLCLLYGRGSSSSARCCTAAARCKCKSRSLCTRRASPCSLGRYRTRSCPSSCPHCSCSSTSTPMTSSRSYPRACLSILCRSLLVSSCSARAHPTCAIVVVVVPRIVVTCTRPFRPCQSQLLELAFSVGAHSGRAIAQRQNDQCSGT